MRHFAQHHYIIIKLHLKFPRRLVLCYLSIYMNDDYCQKLNENDQIFHQMWNINGLHNVCVLEQ